MKPASMDAVFQGLAHASRRRILDIVKDMPGCSVNDVCKYFGTSRIAVMKHLNVLEKAELIVSKKTGRTRALHFNAVPIQMIYDRWTTEFSAFWASRVTDLKYLAESPIESANTLSGKSTKMSGGSKPARKKSRRSRKKT